MANGGESYIYILGDLLGVNEIDGGGNGFEVDGGEK